MKAVFIGGGAHRLLPILRGALAEPGIFSGGEIHLQDLNVERARVMGELLRKTPEYRAHPVRIVWDASLEEALEGADVVSVILMAGSPLLFEWGNQVSLQNGFFGSDNVSPNGAFLAMKTAPIVFDIARRMERLCPNAWLLDFANPVAVMSALVNRHTKVKALGVCAGFSNHLWDLGRILGKDARIEGLDVDVAGINHLSFITRGTLSGKNLFSELDRTIADAWTMPELLPDRSDIWKKMITRSVTNLVRFYRELGVLIFSTEPDGMGHLYPDEYVESNAPRPPRTRGQVEDELTIKAEKRMHANREFARRAGENLDATFWNTQGIESLFSREEDDIFLRALKGISGVERVKVATSYPNRGAIEGLPDHVVAEYSQFLFKGTLEAAGNQCVPAIVHGLVSGLAMHQTLLADACAEDDPELLARALLAYPLQAHTRKAKKLYRELFEVHREELPQSLRKASDYL